MCIVVVLIEKINIVTIIEFENFWALSAFSAQRAFDQAISKRLGHFQIPFNAFIDIQDEQHRNFDWKNENCQNNRILKTD